MGFQHRAVLCGLMHAMVTAGPDIAHFITTPSKSSSAPPELHCQLLKGLTKCLQVRRSWGIKHCGPKDELLDDTSDSDCKESIPFPEAIGEFTVDIAQPKLIGSVDVGHGSELQKQRSITGCALSFLGGAIAHKSETQIATLSTSTETEFCCCLNCCKSCLTSEIHPPGTWISTRRTNRDSCWQSGCTADNQQQSSPNNQNKTLGHHVFQPARLARRRIHFHGPHCWSSQSPA